MKYLLPLLLLGASPVGAPCIFVGDEIAQSVSAYKPECAVYTRPGSSSLTLQSLHLNHTYPKVYISVGTNGHLNPKLGPNLFTIRRKLKTSAVTWIAPRNPRGQEAVFETAVHFHDRIVYLSKIRPKGLLRSKDYKAVAQQL